MKDPDVIKSRYLGRGDSEPLGDDRTQNVNTVGTATRE